MGYLIRHHQQPSLDKAVLSRVLLPIQTYFEEHAHHVTSCFRCRCGRHHLQPRARSREDHPGKLHRRMVFDITSRHNDLLRIAKLDSERRLHQNPLDREKRFLRRRSALRSCEDAAQKGYCTIRYRLHSNDHGPLPIRWSGDGRYAPNVRV